MRFLSFFIAASLLWCHAALAQIPGGSGSITVGAPIVGGTSTCVLYDLAGVVACGASFTNNAGVVAAGTSLAIGGCTIGSNNLCTNGPVSFGTGSNGIVLTPASANSVNMAGEIRAITDGSPFGLFGCNATSDATSRCIASDVVGDTNNRFSLNVNGGMFWGPGSGAADVALARSSTGVLTITGGLNTTGILSVLTRIGVTGTDNVLALLVNGSTKALRVVPTATGTNIEGVDSTGSISFQPLTIGGSALLVATSGAAGLPTDATKTDRSVCIDSTTGQLYQGSGTLGICLGTSSARFKHDIEDATDGLDAVMRLSPKNYRYNVGYGDDGANVQSGFLAEDVIASIPKLVGHDAEGRPNTVDMLGMIPILVRAIQQQQAEIEGLRR